uniref:Pheromone-binding protein 3 n=1 Tax=Scirpophaga excerptalis TaxID=236802 RepID=A0A345D2V7_9NEOP|nr:pheromone-binding protein 3 [Scirpophaga excerptalis]
MHQMLTNMLKVAGFAILIFTISFVNSANVKTDDNSAKAKSDNMKDGNDEKKTEATETIDLMAVMVECNETFRIEMGYIDALNQSGSFPDETDKTQKCYVRCVLEKTGIATPDAQYDTSRTAMIFANRRSGRELDDLKDIAATCAANRTETCTCERAYGYVKCFMESEISKYE